jgi:hypothetical protein
MTVSFNPTRTIDSHLKRTISTNCCIHTVVPPDDGPGYARNLYRLTKYTENKLCIKLIFLYTISCTVFKPLVLFNSKGICKTMAGDTLSPRHMSSCDVNACSWVVRCELALKSITEIHTSVTLLTSRNLAWSSGWLTCQHASQISAVAHISWDVTYVSSALQTLPVVSRNGGNAYWKSAPTDLFIWHQVTRL